MLFLCLALIPAVVGQRTSILSPASDTSDYYQGKHIENTTGIRQSKQYKNLRKGDDRPKKNPECSASPEFLSQNLETLQNQFNSSTSSMKRTRKEGLTSPRWGYNTNVEPLKVLWEICDKTEADATEFCEEGQKQMARFLFDKYMHTEMEVSVKAWLEDQYLRPDSKCLTWIKKQVFFQKEFDSKIHILRVMRAIFCKYEYRKCLRQNKEGKIKCVKRGKKRNKDSERSFLFRSKSTSMTNFLQAIGINDQFGKMILEFMGSKSMSIKKLQRKVPMCATKNDGWFKLS